MHKIQLVVIAVLFMLNGVFAQTLKEFPQERTAFLTALDGFINATKQKDNQAAYDAFSQNVMSGQFSDNQLADIQEIANRMLGLKMNANNYFESYLRSLNMMIANGQKDKLNGYLTTLRDFSTSIKSNNKTSFKNFTNFAADLFEKNALRYVKSSSIWLTMTRYILQKPPAHIFH